MPPKPRSRSASPPISSAADPNPRRGAECGGAERQIGLAEADLFPAFSLTGSFGGAASNVRRATLGDVFTGKGFLLSASGRPFRGTSSIMARSPIMSGCRTQSCRVCSWITRTAVLKAQKEVEDGLAKLTDLQKQVVYLRERHRRSGRASTSP